MNKIQSITYNPQEYLQIELNTPLSIQSRVYYLASPFLVNCFVHPQDYSIVFFDTQNVLSLKHYILHNSISKENIKQWCLFLIEQFEIEDDGYFITQLEYVFYDQKNNQLMLCKIPFMKDHYAFERLAILLLELYECMNYEGNQEWISQLYLILKTKPFRVELLKQFLVSKKTKRFLSIFKKEEEDKLDDFFKMIQVKESQPIYGINTVPFETQILMAGYQCGFLVNDHQEKILITSSPWYIGRNKECDFVLDFPEISKTHCVIYFEEGRCYLEDQGSTNGTRINENKISSYKKIQIKETDVISLAGHQFTYYV